MSSCNFSCLRIARIRFLPTVLRSPTERTRRGKEGGGRERETSKPINISAAREILLYLDQRIARRSRSMAQSPVPTVSSETFTSAALIRRSLPPPSRTTTAWLIKNYDVASGGVPLTKSNYSLRPLLSVIAEPRRGGPSVCKRTRAGVRERETQVNLAVYSRRSTRDSHSNIASSNAGRIFANTALRV